MSEEDLWDVFQKELDALRHEAEKLMRICDIIAKENKILKEEIMRLKKG